MSMGQNGGTEGTTWADKDLQDRASHVAGEAGKTVEDRASDLMTQASATIGQVAGAFRHVGDDLRKDQPQLADLADMAASRMDDAASYLRQHDAGEVMSATQEAARRQPAVAIGGGLLLGFALARLLRSSEPMSSGSNGGYGSMGRRSGYGAGARFGGGFDSGRYGTGGGTGWEPSAGGHAGMGASGPGTGYAGDAATTGGYGTSERLAGDPDALGGDPTVVEEVDVIEVDGGPTDEG
jgi:hypothetical protein